MPYYITTPEVVLQEFQELHQKACQIGMGDKVLAAAKTIAQHLQDDPLGFGEPVQNLPSLNMVLWVGIVPPLVARYSVNEEQQLVFLKALRALPGHGL